MSKRVSSIYREGNTLYVTYNDCSVEEIDLCTDCEPAPSDNPGDWPPPITSEETRCRVSLFTGDSVVDRLIDFFSGLNLSDGSFNFYEAYAVNRISVYGWPIGLYGAVLSFEYSLFEGALEHDPGRGLSAKDEYDLDPAGTLFNVQEDLYCILGDNGDFSETVRGLWIARLMSRGTDFYLTIADFIALWPLDQLREIAFNGSITTDAVDCGLFDCEGGLDECSGVDIIWNTVGATPPGWTTLGMVSTSGWLGDTTDLAGDYTCSRSSGDQWRKTTSVTGSDYIGIRYTFSEDCLLTTAFLQYFDSSNNSKRLAIAVRLSDDTYKVLVNFVDNVIAPSLLTIGWDGVEMIKEILYMCATGAPNGIGMRIDRTHFNS